jgi:hypothetical protein
MIKTYLFFPKLPNFIVISQINNNSQKIGDFPNFIDFRLEIFKTLRISIKILLNFITSALTL